MSKNNIQDSASANPTVSASTTNKKPSSLSTAFNYLMGSNKQDAAAAQPAPASQNAKTTATPAQQKDAAPAAAPSSAPTPQPAKTTAAPAQQKDAAAAAPSSASPASQPAQTTQQQPAGKSYVQAVAGFRRDRDIDFAAITGANLQREVNKSSLFKRNVTHIAESQLVALSHLDTLTLNDAQSHAIGLDIGAIPILMVDGRKNLPQSLEAQLSCVNVAAIMVPLRFSGPFAIYHHVSRNARRIIDAAEQAYFFACKSNTALILVNIHFDETKKQFFAAQKTQQSKHVAKLKHVRVETTSKSARIIVLELPDTVAANKAVPAAKAAPNAAAGAEAAIAEDDGEDDAVPIACLVAGRPEAVAKALKLNTDKKVSAEGARKRVLETRLCHMSDIQMTEIIADGGITAVSIADLTADEGVQLRRMTVRFDDAKNANGDKKYSFDDVLKISSDILSKYRATGIFDKGALRVVLPRRITSDTVEEISKIKGVTKVFADVPPVIIAKKFDVTSYLVKKDAVGADGAAAATAAAKPTPKKIDEDLRIATFESIEPMTLEQCQAVAHNIGASVVEYKIEIGVLLRFEKGKGSSYEDDLLEGIINIKGKQNKTGKSDAPPPKTKIVRSLRIGGPAEKL